MFYLKYIWVKIIKSLLFWFIYLLSIILINLAVFYTFTKGNVHVTDMTNRDGDDIVCDG